MYILMLKQTNTDLNFLYHFLKKRTPQAWLAHAAKNISLLLLDHAHCERKAAATAINFMSKYPERKELVTLMSPLAREELLHFEKVIDIMHARGLCFGPLQPSEYASTMHKLVTKRDGSERLRDQLIIGAIIEARSCERFASLSEVIEDVELAKFYKTLVKAEARHFMDYLELARLYGGSIEERIAYFLSVENRFIQAEDKVFRFHSGLPELNGTSLM